MENLPRPFSRKNFTAYGGGGGKSMYDDVFGGAPKSGLNSLAPRLQDYTEIFGGFHSSRSSSIPVLDLPSVNVNEHAVDVRSSRFDYSEVFSRPNGVDFVVSFEDLVCEANGGYDSSDEAWSPTHSGSLSGETEPSACSEKSQSFPNADINHYNVSYNKTHQRSQENISNDLHAIPVYTCVVDETTVSEKVHEEERFYQIRNDLKHSPDFEDRVVKEKRYSKTSKSGPITSVPHLGVSEISLRTKPSQLPPPSRPAPVLAVKKGESVKLRASKSYAFERGLVGDNFSPFFDVELDGYSSSATIKDDAETRSSVRSTEKVIELQVEDDMKVMKRNRTQSFDKCNDKELNLNLLEKSVERKHRRSYTSSEGYFKREENVAWREEAGFYEVETDIIHQVKSKNIGKRVELKESNNKIKSAKIFLGLEDNFNQPKVSKQEVEAKTEKKVIKDVDSRKGNEIEFEGVHCEKGEEVTVEEIKAEETHDKEEMEGKKKIQEESLERKESTNEKELNGIRDGENDEHIELKSSLVNEDYKEILQKSCEHEEIEKDFEASLKEDTCKIEKDHTEIIQNEAVEQAIAFKDKKSDEQSKGEKFMAFGNYEPNLQFKPGFVPRNNNQNVLQHEEHTKKPNEVGSVSEKPSNSQVKVVSSTENMPIISPEVVVPIDKGNTREKLTSHEVVKEWVDNAKNINDSLQSVLEDIGVISDSDQSTTTQESPDKAKIGKTFKNKEIIIEKEMERQREKEKDMMAETRRIKERELEKERIRKIEEEREREREREKDRMDMDSALRERSYLDAREKSERATYEVRQRVMAEARERLEKASAEAREARMRAERSAVERATMEARQRAFAKSMAEPRDRLQNTDIRFQRTGSSSVFRYTPSSSSSVGDCESPQRCKARLERYQRTAERAAKALAEKNTRDLAAQREQEERSRLAEILDVEVRRWSSGKEGNLRALLSTLQYILGADGNWQPIPLTEVITSAAVKRAYRKATLYVHPDKLQQRGASIQQKYICEKVFDLLKDAWSKFNSEER